MAILVYGSVNLRVLFGRWAEAGRLLQKKQFQMGDICRELFFFHLKVASFKLLNMALTTLRFSFFLFKSKCFLGKGGLGI